MTPDDHVQTVRELATHASDIKHLQDDMDKLVADINAIKVTLLKIQNMMSEAEGRDKTMKAGLATVASLIGGAVVWVLDRVFK